jgi:hypothetical protein
MQPLDDFDYLKRTMKFVYQLVVASTPLLSFAILRAEGPLKAYYEEHLKEELGHDEMLRRDLVTMGVTEFAPNHIAAQVAGAQYYLIAHTHPALLLGYMHALERDSLPVEEVDRLSKLHGVELTALRHHAKHDPEHRKDLERVIASLPSEQQELVRWNEDWSRALFEQGAQ